MGTLYLVATPIGNLEDISARALRILGEAVLIAAEDTRVTQKLLNYFDIRTRTTSYFEHNKLTKLNFVLAKLDEGDVALVSDAGTPALNDPGFELVRAALEAGHRVSPVPGPASPIAALTASGLPTDTFLYLGYLPRKSSERKAALKKVADLPHTLVLFETPHRLMESLDDIETILGQRQTAACRELTKLHEEVLRGTVNELRAQFEKQEPRGEFVLVIEGAKTRERGRWTEDRLLAAIKRGLKSGQPASQMAGELAGQSGWPRREVYRRITRP